MPGPRGTGSGRLRQFDPTRNSHSRSTSCPAVSKICERQLSRFLDFVHAVARRLLRFGTGPSQWRLTSAWMTVHGRQLRFPAFAERCRSLNSSKRSEFWECGHSRISTGGAGKISTERPLQKLRPFAHDPNPSAGIFCSSARYTLASCRSLSSSKR